MAQCWCVSDISRLRRTSFCGAPMPRSIAGKPGSGTIGPWKCIAYRGDEGRAGRMTTSGKTGAVRRVLIRSVIVIIVLAVTWFAAGRQLTTLLDRFLTVQVTSLPTTPMAVGTGQFV